MLVKIDSTCYTFVDEKKSEYKDCQVRIISESNLLCDWVIFSLENSLEFMLHNAIFKKSEIAWNG